MDICILRDMKKQVFYEALTMWVLAICLCGGYAPASAQVFWDGSVAKDWQGSGSETDPIRIASPSQLAGLADSVNGGDSFRGRHIVLTNDIYLTDTTVAKDLRPEWEPIGHRVMHAIGEAQDSASFEGHFDGAGYSIHFLYTGATDGFSGWDDLDDPTFEGTIDGSTWYKSLFGYVGETATIRNLHLRETSVLGSADVAGIALYNRGRIEDCSVEGAVISAGDVGGGTGGIAFTNYGDIVHCRVSAYVEGARSVGTIVGVNVGNIADCYGDGVVRAREYHAGGLVGQNTGVITDSHADVTVRHSAYKYSATDVGGFVAYNTGTIRHCSARGDIYTVAFHGGGGFVARNVGRIESCYALGDTYGSSYGLTGTFVNTNGHYAFHNGWSEFTPGIIINCFATGRNMLSEDNSTWTVSRHGFCVNQDMNANSLMVNCYSTTNHGINPDDNAYVGGAELRDSLLLQTRSFVDTLNMIAAWTGTSTWQYNEGGYPTPTGDISTSITDYCAGGNGTVETPYLIATKQHLQNLATVVNKGYDFREQHIRQTADIALNRPMEEWGEEMPTLWQPIGDMVNTYQHDFRGNYNGDFHVVRNMYLWNFKEYQGFFGTLNHGAVVRNVGIEDAYIKAKGCVGILAGQTSRYACDVTIAQCWTSGQAEGEWAAGGILGSIALEGNTHILNCRSTANLTAVNYASAVVGDQNYIGGETYSNDTVGNFLFAGTLKGTTTARPALVIPMRGNERHFHGYFDNEHFPAIDTNDARTLEENCAATTQYLHSKEVVNIYNAWVDEYNSHHTFQLDYWQPNVQAYPTVSPVFIPAHTVRFVSNGGGEYADLHAVDSSYIPVPKTPEQEGKVFAGWYSDAACTSLFVFDRAMVVSDTTLYAKWCTPIAYDITPFTNPFATTYTIRTAEQLYGFAVAVNGMEGVIDAMTFEGKTVRLAADLMLNDTADWAYWGDLTEAAAFAPIGHYGSPFSGVFDGQGHTIRGVYAHGKEYVGLFGYIGAKGSVRNLHIAQSVVRGLDQSDVSMHGHLGLLAAVNDGAVAHCTVQGKVLGSKWFDGASYVGGLIGSSKGKVSCCGADVYVRGFYNVGGLIGENTGRDTISCCYAKGLVEGKSPGGLVGNAATVKNCYSLAEVYGQTNAAGLLMGDPTMANAYCANAVWVNHRLLDGAVSIGTRSKLTNVYYLSHDAPRENTYCGTALTALQMHTRTAFAGFDFEQIWGRKDTINAGFPYLRWEYDAYIPDDPDVEYVPVTGITIENAPKEMLIHTTHRLQAQVLPADATNQNVLWESLSTDIATVDETGLVRAIAKGRAVLTAKTQEGLKTANCTIDVITPQIVLSGSSAYRTIVRGETLSLTATFRPDSIAKDIVWVSTEPTVASVDKGLVTALSVGKTEIYAETTDGTIRSASIRLTVVWNAVTGVSISGVSSLAVGESATLAAVFSPTNASNRHVSWRTSNEAVLSVSDAGVVTGNAVGTATVSVLTDDGGYTATHTIEVVSVPATGIRFTDYAPTLKVGETYPMQVEVLPANATDKRVVWESSNSSVLRVDETGLLTALGEGRRITITATTVDGGYTASQTVRVSGYLSLEDFALDYTELTMTKGEMQTLTPVCTPAGLAELVEVVWESSDATVASVADGIVFAQDTGTVQITATATYGDNTLTASCQIHVLLPAEKECIQVRLLASSAAAWEKVYLYAWIDGVELAGVPWTVYPGVLVEKDVDGWYAYTFDKDISEVNLMWNNGAGDQTEEIYGVRMSTCYELTAECGTAIPVRVTECDQPTAIETNQVISPMARKVVMDNMLYIILPDGMVYNATGQPVHIVLP